MLHLTADETPGPAPRGRTARAGKRSLERLERALRDDADRDGEALAIRVSESCGCVEVCVSGPGARLRLFFDRAELQPGRVRQVVRQAVAQYGSAFASRPTEPSDRVDGLLGSTDGRSERA